MTGGGGSSAPTTTTNKSEFADEQKPYITDIFQRAQQGFNQVAGKTFSGPTYAGVNSAQTGALAETEALANTLAGYGNGTKANAEGFQNNVTSGRYTDPLTDAFVVQNPQAQLEQAIFAAVDPLKRQLLGDVLPGLSNAAVEQGAYGGSKFQDLQSKAIRGFNDQALNVASTLSYEDLARREALNQKDLSERRNLAPALFDAELKAGTTASSLLDSALNQNLAGSNLRQQVGDERQRQEQEAINAKIADFQRSLSEPFTGLDIYSSFIQGFGNPLNATSTTSGVGKSGGGFSGAAKGALGGAAIGSVVPGIGTLAGGALGGLAGFF